MARQIKKSKAIAKKTTTKEKQQEKQEVKKKYTKTHDDFFDTVIRTTENDLAQAASNGIIAGDIRGWIDTGVLLLNAQVSGSLWGGVPNNKIVVFAGPEATGKTFFLLSIVKFFLDSDPRARVVYYESESAITKKQLEERNIDTTRVYIVPVSTVQEWRTQSLKVLRAYKELDNRPPMMMCLDSLGMLSTTKEMEDSESGSETKDMTRAALIKAAFRTLTLKLGILDIPFLITNHTYDEQGKLYAAKVMSGGSGTKYSNSITIFLSKRKEKESGEVTGVIITCTLKKGRTTKENTVIEVKLDYAKGLHRYFGLLELAAEAKIIRRVDNRYMFPDENGVFPVDAKDKPLKGSLIKEKVILSKPTEYFTDKVMAQLEEVVQKKFNYGSAIDMSGDDEDVEEIEIPEDE